MIELGPSSTAADIIAHLKTLRNETNIAGMARFGIVTDTALGISNTDLRTLARQIKTDHARALALWASNIREARLLAAFTDDPKQITIVQARAWTHDCNSWELVDAVNEPIVRTGHHDVLIAEFAANDREFVRRMAFSMICWAAVHLKKEPDARILAWLPLIEAYSTDKRNFVRKAVNWALRTIGKRSLACHGPALALAEKLAASADKTERWIGKDAVRELSSDKVLTKIQLKSARATPET